MAALFAACTNGIVRSTLPHLFQQGLKCRNLLFRIGAVCSICIGKVGHHALNLKGAVQEWVVEDCEQLFRRKSQPAHPGFDLEVNRVGSWM